jgi:GT2 family glycosyltransferase/Flp pilus assembly protein TadD/2-polyprenyl-3-methyl-5-hydroxy-6-metoxy-1,4-benzoquinol methylase
VKTVMAVGLFPDRNRAFLTQLARRFRVIMLRGEAGWGLAGMPIDVAEDIIGPEGLGLTADELSAETQKSLAFLESELAQLSPTEVHSPVSRDDAAAFQQLAHYALYVTHMVRRVAERVPVDMLITNADYSRTRRPAVLEARRLGIPTLCIEHGFFVLPEPHAFKPDFVPVFPFVSDYVNVDNRIETGIFESYYRTAGATTAVKLLAHGTPNDISYDPRLTREAAIDTLGLDRSKRTITLVGSWLFAILPSVIFQEIVEEGEFYEAAMKAVASLPDPARYQLVVKLHPAVCNPPILQDTRNYLQKLASRAGISRCLITHNHLSEVLSASDLIVAPNYTSVLWEGFLAGVPGIVYPSAASLETTFIKERLNDSNALFRSGCLRHVFSPEELADSIPLLTDAAHQKELAAAGRKLRHKYEIRVETAEEKSKRICSWISHLLKDDTVGTAAPDRRPIEVPGPKKAGAKTENSSGTATSKGRASAAAGYYSFARPEIQALVPKTARNILDVGCAAGRLGAALRARQPCEVTGIECLPEMAEAARQVLDTVYAGDALEVSRTLPSHHYDCIIMADVLEHLADPAGVLSALAATLAPNGCFVFSIPNVRHWSVVRGLLEGNWDYAESGLLDRSHLRFFTRASFEKLLRQVGMRPVAISGVTMGDGLPGSTLRALAEAGLEVSTLDQESRVYQFQYVAQLAVEPSSQLPTPPSAGETGVDSEMAELQELVGKVLEGGQRALEAGDLETAAAEFESVARQYPKLAAAHTALGSTMIALGRVQDAIPSLQIAADLLPYSSSIQNQLGVALFQTGSAAGAESAFLRAAEADVQDIQSRLNLLELYRIGQRYDLAIESAKELIEAWPNSTDVLVSVAQLSLEIGDSDAAQKAIARLGTIDPVNASLPVLRTAAGLPETADVNGRDCDSSTVPTAHTDVERPDEAKSALGAPIDAPPTECGLTSIIILMHNQLDATRQCLASIEAHTPEKHELILVDNGSTDGTLDYVQDYAKACDNVRVIANCTNRGFAAGNNQGLALASGESILLLNNDTVVTNGWLGHMLAVFARHPETGVVGPRAHWVSGPQMVFEASYNTIQEMQQFAELWSTEHAGKNTTTTRLVGFCLLIRRSVVDRLGGLDERFGSGNFEDDDYCVRAALSGFEARIAQDVFIHHTGGQTFKGAGINYTESMLRNWELFKAKWAIPHDTPIAKGYTIPVNVPKVALAPIGLPNVGADHVARSQGRLWLEVAPQTPLTSGETTSSRPVSAVVMASDKAGGFWKSLVECSSVPLAATVVGQIAQLPNRLGKDWSVEGSDRSAATVLNETLLAPGDDLVLLLSTSTILTPDWLDPLRAALAIDPAIGVVGPTSNKAPAPQRIHAKYDGADRGLRRFATRRGKMHAGQTSDVPYLGGFCLAFSREACRKVGPLLVNVDFQTALWEYFGRLQGAGCRLVVAQDCYVHLDSLSENEGAKYDELAYTQEAITRTLAPGQCALEAGDLETALHAFESVVHEYPNLAAAQTALGSTLMSLRKVGEAIPPLRRASELAPNSSALHNQLGVALFQTGDLAEAEAAFQKAKAADTTDVQPILNLIDLYRGENRYTEATEEVKQAMGIDPNNANVLVSLAVLSLELGDAEAAEMAVERVGKIQPEHPALDQLRQALPGVHATI